MVDTDNPTITDPTSRGGHKPVYTRRNFSRHQLRTPYRRLADEEFTSPDTMLVLFSYGGAVNAHAGTDTASAQRDNFTICFQTFWHDPAEDVLYLNWLRASTPASSPGPAERPSSRRWSSSRKFLLLRR